jgi:2-C-methyl-D-erythritol 4-phosphate cytidylyltransferase|tara:strand:+ start:3622 stop:4323 length:702 start_codon:yes stop_codon:yes gene_type:complete
MANYHVIIPAAGKGSRMRQDTPKQFFNLEGKTILQWVEFIFSNIMSIKSISIAIQPEIKFLDTLGSQFSNKTKIYKTGGDTRAQTVLNTINKIKNLVSDDDWILVHDAARVGITELSLNNFIDDISSHKVGGIMAIPVADTVKKVNDNMEIITTENREKLWLAQTPQMFRYKILKKALEQFDGTPTDEAEAIESLGLKPKIFKGNVLNTKITYEEDLVNANKAVELMKKSYLS